MEDYFEGLLYYWDGERYPFACHPTFRYVALNMTFRHHAWNRAIIFANRQLPAGISVNTIKEQASRLCSHPSTTVLAAGFEAGRDSQREFTRLHRRITVTSSI